MSNDPLNSSSAPTVRGLAERAASRVHQAADVPTTRPVWRQPGILGWAVYLACSWTWCIGMFLPVLLVRDYGLLGYIVFAVPNVIGAGAMGWFITNRQISRRVVSRHLAACRLFSVVTAAFQMYFLLTFVIIPWVQGGEFTTRLIVCTALIAAATISLRLLNVYRTGAWATWLVSLGTMTAFIATTDSGEFPRELFDSRDSLDLLFMAPVVVFGFLLCPYMDLTFHEAARRTPSGTTRRTFGLGFGVFFLIMILGTLLYVTPVLDGPVHGVLTRLPLAASLPLLIHWIMQLGFTTRVHNRFTQRYGSWRRASWWDGVPALLLLGTLLFLNFAGAPTNKDPSLHTPFIAGLYAPEVGYRGFMSFYGLVFPAYVWLCMIPRGGAVARPSRHTLTVFAAAVTIATPFYWMGFIEREEIWLIPGLLIVLAARLLVKKNTAVPV